MNLFSLLAATVAGLFLLISCAQSPSNGTGGGKASGTDRYGAIPYKTYPLLWEGSSGEGERWSSYSLKVIHEEVENDLINGAEDIDTFCPEYESLSTNERLNFWALLVSAMTKYESRYNPLSRMRESTLGTDPITGTQVFSEGLLQLSYQDVRRYKFCEFDWEKDRKIDGGDPAKTILDPYKNLNCGIKILAFQIRDKNRITLEQGAYWSVLKLGSKYRKITEIAALTKKMPGCTREP